MKIRQYIASVLSSNPTHLIVLSIFITLTIMMDSIAYFFGAGYVLVVLWSRGWDWQWLGLSKPGSWRRLLIQAAGLALLIFVVGDILITPIIEKLVGQTIDLRALDGLRGSLVNYLLFIGFMWVVAAFGEEFIYRGFLIERTGAVFSGTMTAKWLLALFSALLFGMAHRYQGLAGMITTGMIGFAFGAIFLLSQKRLWLTIITHGLYDVIGITLIYLDIDREVYEILSL